MALNVEVKNAGLVAGAEAVQLYVRDEYGSVTRPVKELKAIRKVFLKPGESVDIQFDITPEMLACWGASEKWEVEPGEFTLMVGSSSADSDLRTIRLSCIHRSADQ